MNAETDSSAAIRDDMADLGGTVAEMTDAMLRILHLVEPLLHRSAASERHHNQRSDSIRHTGRRRRQTLPFCGGLS